MLFFLAFQRGVALKKIMVHVDDMREQRKYLIFVIERLDSFVSNFLNVVNLSYHICDFLASLQINVEKL